MHRRDVLNTELDAMRQLSRSRSAPDIGFAPVTAAVSLLIITQDPAVVELLELHFSREGYSLTVAPSGDDARVVVMRQPPDLIVLDDALPDIPGLRLLDQLRRLPSGAAVPIILLSSRHDEDGRLEGLTRGADDCLTKPFSTRELAVRISVLLRRAPGGAAGGSRLTAGAICVDLLAHQVFIGGKPISLTPLEYKLLTTFLEQRNRLLSRGQLLRRVWQMSGAVDESDTRTVDMHVKRLRSKLGECGDMIETVRGAGYRLSSTRAAAS